MVTANGWPSQGGASTDHQNVQAELQTLVLGPICFLGMEIGLAIGLRTLPLGMELPFAGAWGPIGGVRHDAR